MIYSIYKPFWYHSTYSKAFYLALVVAMAGSCVASASAAPFRLAVPFWVDKKDIPSTMVLELEAEDLGGRGLSELNQPTAHPSLIAFHALMGHFASGRSQAAADMLLQRPSQKLEDGLSFAKMFSISFKNFGPSMVVRRRYDVGPETWLSWEIKRGDDTWNRVFRFAQSDGQWYWAEELRSSPLRSMQTLVSAAEQALIENQKDATKVAGLNFRFSVRVPDMSARWLFNGFSTSWNAFGNGPVPDHPVTKMYASAIKALYQGDFELFAAAHLPFSAQRIREGFAKMTDAERASYVENLRNNGRQVIFVLDATPIFIVFYDTTRVGLQYDTLFAPGGDLTQVKLCNFSSETFIDEIMKESVFFQDPVIRPFAGRPEDPQVVGATTSEATKGQEANEQMTQVQADKPLKTSEPLQSTNMTPSPVERTSWYSGGPAWGWLMLLLVVAFSF